MFSEFHKNSSASSSVSSFASLLETEANSWKDVVVSREVQKLLFKSEIEGVLISIKNLPAEAVASHEPGLESSRLSTALTRFYAVIFSQIAPQFDRLSDPGLRENLRHRIVEKICMEYSLVWIAYVISDLHFNPHFEVGGYHTERSQRLRSLFAYT